MYFFLGDAFWESGLIVVYCLLKNINRNRCNYILNEYLKLLNGMMIVGVYPRFKEAPLNKITRCEDRQAKAPRDISIT